MDGEGEALAKREGYHGNQRTVDTKECAGERSRTAILHVVASTIEVHRYNGTRQ